MTMTWIDKLFGDANARYLKNLQPVIEETNNLEAKFKDFSSEQLKAETQKLKEEIKQGKELDEIIAPAFALVREAGKRTLKQRHFDVQLLGGLVLHKGQIAEMSTGEGKTLTATLPLFLNALAGKGCHLVTVNDYLARRDCVWMGQIYNLLGLSVSCIQHESAFIYDSTYTAPQEVEEERDRGVVVNENFLRPIKRREAYEADITYGTNNEFGFDYLRDNMAPLWTEKVQRPLNFAIVDEVDSILIDEARTPLIISAAAEESADMYRQFAAIARTLKENEDYNIDEKMRAATLTEKGLEKVEKMLGSGNIYEASTVKTVHHLESALKAETLFKRDKDYVIKEGEVIIVDEFTGRLMYGRRYSEGLHQAIEAKEGVKVQRESITMATITFQNYFRLYKKLAGMTGTAATESEEFAKIYKLDVTVIPTNKPNIRKDSNDLIYKTEVAKFEAVVKEIKSRQAKGQPVLVGTISIEKNEILSDLLAKSGVKHEILNAKNHDREALIIAQAGRQGAVTLATNMAGRGVDIILGGNPPDLKITEEVKALGGLHVIGTERHESRRIDNQLRGRSGRQGDPGSTQFFVSLDDDLMRIFGSDRIKGLMNTLRVPDDMPIENGMITRSLESAQKKVEGNNFDIRKHLVEYDDVIAKQREVVYKKRDQILLLADGQQIDNYSSTKDLLKEMIETEITTLVNFHTPADNPELWNLKEVAEAMDSMLELSSAEKQKINESTNTQSLLEYLLELAWQKYDQMEQDVANLPDFKGKNEPLRNIERGIMLNSLDTIWVEHLENIDSLRTGIGLRGYGQHDPLVEFKKEAYFLFKDLLNAVQNQVVYSFFKIGRQAKIALSPMAKNLQYQGSAKTAASKQSQFKQTDQSSSQQTPIINKEKVGRNDPCPCGSGLKYKKCHGK